MKVEEVLKKLNISYETLNHEPVYTSEEAAFIKERLKGKGIKNLFLTSDLNIYYLVLIEDFKKANIKELSKLVNTTHLTFAKEESLKRILNVEKGSVSPLNLINDKSQKVIVLIDNDLKNNKVLVHLNTNRKTISIDFNDLIRFIQYLGNKVLFFA